jgi:hypothetical protein
MPEPNYIWNYYFAHIKKNEKIKTAVNNVPPLKKK